VEPVSKLELVEVLRKYLSYLWRMYSTRHDAANQVQVVFLGTVFFRKRLVKFRH